MAPKTESEQTIQIISSKLQKFDEVGCFQQQSIENSIISRFKNKEFIISYTKKSGLIQLSPRILSRAQIHSLFPFIPQHLNYLLCDLNVAAKAPDITSSPNNILRWWTGVAASFG